MASRAHLLVSGRVQGVFFRHETARRASEAGLSGWVRNLDDGRVEVVLQGEPDAVDRVIAWCREGPPMATVEEVSVDWEDPRAEPGFSVR